MSELAPGILALGYSCTTGTSLHVAPRRPRHTKTSKTKTGTTLEEQSMRDQEGRRRGRTSKRERARCKQRSRDQAQTAMPRQLQARAQILLTANDASHRRKERSFQVQTARQTCRVAQPSPVAYIITACMRGRGCRVHASLFQVIIFTKLASCCLASKPQHT